MIALLTPAKTAGRAWMAWPFRLASARPATMGTPASTVRCVLLLITIFLTPRWFARGLCLTLAPYMTIATDINECAPNPCQNGGTCEDLVNDFNCACVAGYSGENCENGEWLALGVCAPLGVRSSACLTPHPLPGPVRSACRHQRMRGRRVPERRHVRGPRERVQLRVRRRVQRGELRNE